MKEIIDVKNFEFPDIRKRNPLKMILEDKSNCVNTIKNFYNEDEEKVKNLNFFDPKIFSLENKDIIRNTSYGLFNIQTTANLNAKKSQKINKENQSEKNKEDSGKK